VRSGLGADLGDGKGRCLMAGEWNAAIYEPMQEWVRPEDVHCAKNRMSGMWGLRQPLWEYLDSAGKRTLLFTGVNTDQCVLGTLVDAYNAGWDCILVEDCSATTTPNGKDVCLSNIGVRRIMAFVCRRGFPLLSLLRGTSLSLTIAGCIRIYHR
jgi:phosphatidylethanolamine-binding protein